MDSHDRKLPAAEANIESVATSGSVLETFGKIVFFVVVLEIVVMFFLSLYQDSRIRTLGLELASLQDKLASPQYATLNNQIEEVLSGSDQLKGVLNNRLKWSTFYTQLNAVTPKNVRFSAITISETGTFKADGETASLGSLAHALVTLKDGTSTTPSPFTSVTLSSNSFADIEGRRLVTFSVTGKVNTAALHEKK